MKQLFWKEWYELRLLPLAAALCVVLLTAGAKVYSRAYGNTQPFQLSDASMPLMMTWGMFCIVAGSGLFAQEIGSGSLAFLNALPVSRRRLWWVKCAAATGVLLLSLCASGVTWMVIVHFLLPATTPAAMWHSFGLADGESLLTVILLLDMFAVALAVSPYLDRPVSAIMAAGLAAAVCYGIVALLMSAYLQYHSQAYFNSSIQGHVIIPPQRDYNHLLTISALLPLPVLLAISYWTFTRGETLRSAKRFRVGALSGAISAAIALFAFWGGYWMRWW